MSKLTSFALFALTVLLVISAEAEPARCPKGAGGGTPLFFKLKQPTKEHGPAARAALRERFPCLVFRCTRTGDMVAEVSRKVARQLLGRHVVYGTVKGAGNSENTDASFVDLKPAAFVPELLREHVARLTFDDDPKYDYTGPATKLCE